MQPPRPNLTGLHSVPTTPANPRQRNRLHNQAIRRAKANIGIRRDGIPPPPRTDNEDPEHLRHDPGPVPKAQTDVQRTTAAGSPRMTVSSGGLRGDPFAAFPISADGNVLSTVDYFLQHYAPVHINLREEQTDSLPLSRRYFSLALENAAMFELMVTLAAASYAVRQGHSKAPTKEVLIHHGRGIEALRLKMARPTGYDDDATILSVMALLGIAMIYSDFASFETHLTGLRHLVEMRGGVDSLGWGGFIKNAITGLESIWAFHENKKLSIATTEANIKLEYPEHPFPPDLCVVISKFPDGLGELALSGRFSLQVISLLSRVTDWVHQMQSGWKKGVLPLGEPNGTFLKQTHVCLELIPLRDTTVLERVICVAIVAMTTETFNKVKQRNPVHRRLNATLSEMLFRYDLRRLPLESAIWMALVIAGSLPPSGSGKSGSSTSSPGKGGDELQSPRNILLDKLIRDTAKARNWKWVEPTVRQFLFSEEVLREWRQTWDVALLRYSRERDTTEPKK